MDPTDSTLEEITGRSTEAPHDPYARSAGSSEAISPTVAGPDKTPASAEKGEGEWVVDLERRRDQLTASVAELQWDLGGLVYEMAIRDRVRVDVLIKRAARLQDVDAELGEVERILRMEKSGVAGTCSSCDAPHSSGAVYCWQCGHPLLEQVSSDTISSL
jgi:hypothetical protein